ncbi:histidine kinase [Terrabacter sp. MAHUQ-38]|uniref:sensor histidine kinase n=1 Tax=unclassified Terrabacter TaxID=2630222 RepID=UPI00165D4141|nr:sensor histidine kinase [Terrabacter sp. MAHUQ-38]
MHAPPGPRGQLAASAAVVGPAALLVALTGVTVWLDVANGRTGVPAAAGLEAGWVGCATGLAQLLPGLLLLRRLPRHPVAWVLVVSGAAWVVDSFASSWTAYAVYTSPGLPGASAAFYVYQRLGASLLLGIPLLLLLFPDGRLPRARAWWTASVVSLVFTGLLPAVLAFVPSHVAEAVTESSLTPELRSLDIDPVSLPLPDAVWRVLLGVAFAGIWVSLLVPLAVVVRRYRASTGERRQQLRWLVWAAVVDVVVLAAGLLAEDPLAGLLLAVGVGVTSAAVVVAVTRHRLYEVERLLPATLVYAVLAVIVVGVDVLVFALAGAVLGQRDSALVAIAVVAALYGPLRDRLTGLVRRLQRGARHDPYAVVSALAERLEVSSDPAEQLLAVARSVAEAFRSPFVRVEIEQGSGATLHVEHGRLTGTPVVLPVVYRGEPVGRLLLVPAGRSTLSERDQRLLGDVVRQAAAAARASELSLTLQRSREAIVLAREEERRRLRRDLHDSLGPSLGAVTLRIETARNLAGRDAAAADQLLAAATAAVAEVLADVRRLAHDLRPPALDELGLASAVEEQARRLSSESLAISVRAGHLGELPAAVEVAAYRIVSEALTNVVRHAAATQCDVRLTVAGTSPDDELLVVEVRDDRHGIPSDVAAGVGMLSLRERAAELGGACAVTCPPDGGTVVRAQLPIGASRPAGRSTDATEPVTEGEMDPLKKGVMGAVMEESSGV